MKALLPSTNSTHHYPQLATPSASSTRSASVTLRCLVQPSMIELYIISSGVKCPSLFISCVCPTGNSGNHLLLATVHPTFLVSVFWRFHSTSRCFLEDLSNTSWQMTTCLATANFECRYSTFFLKLKCSVSRQFSPQARWRPFPHHLLEANLRRLCVHFIRFICQFCLFGTTTRPIKIKVIDLLSESETWVKISGAPKMTSFGIPKMHPQVIPKSQSTKQFKWYEYWINAWMVWNIYLPPANHTEITSAPTTWIYSWQNCFILEWFHPTRRKAMELNSCMIPSHVPRHDAGTMPNKWPVRQ